MYFASSAMASVIAAVSVTVPVQGADPPTPTPMASPTETHRVRTRQLSVLTYNVQGLPWPIASGRGEALRSIGRELAQMRRAGGQPDVVLIQEGFREEIADLVKASGYAYWAQGPARFDRAAGSPPAGWPKYEAVRYPAAGEGWGKLTSGGLHVLSDLPIVEVRSAPYRYCAGLDCLANKGVMLARIAVPGVPGTVDIVNTHLNSKRKAKVPMSRTLRAHNLQTNELITFISGQRAPGNALLVGGDFNVRNAPDRYNYRARARPFTVVSEFCDAASARCDGQAPASRRKPWLRSQDLQAFNAGDLVDVQPVKVETVFRSTARAPSPSDHDGYLVRYQLSWPASTLTPARASPSVKVEPRFGAWGVKATWRH